MMQRAALLVRVLAAGSMFLPLVLSSPEADGQLSAERLYNGINRPIAMTVARPPGETEELSIRLLEPVTAQTLHTAPVKEGPINLASTFPHLWQETTPRLVYAQLFAGEHPVGPAVVMQPMEGPRVAQLRPAEARIEWVPQRARAFTGYRCYVDRVAVVQTTAGPIEFIMRPEVAPNTVFNFLHLAENGFYTDILIHRIVPRRADGAPFVIQFGDPTGTGVGTPGYHIDLERSTLQHTYGVLSMARSEDPNTNGSQVFICLSREGTEGLDGSYCAFAQAISGAEAIAALSQTSVDAQGRPTTDPPPLVRSIRLADAPPYGTAPRPITRPTPPPASTDR
ncbi:MAG: peptidylprolyl isomerase [Phycisphaeraceae bacterium]|nr:peptidylprolyl isomerase [Phycisphaerae bacterium]MBX3391057.1 peptidylprolyl isomerase [Phycisphaeraceae bacterium]